MEDLVIMAIYTVPFLLALLAVSVIVERELPKHPRVVRLIERVWQIDLGGDAQ